VSRKALLPVALLLKRQIQSGFALRYEKLARHRFPNCAALDLAFQKQPTTMAAATILHIARFSWALGRWLP
jgi:deoxyinosine 3'endonuclease (endonuclease V)